MNAPSTSRLYLMRGTYLMISVFLATQIWPGIVHHPQLDLMRGVARSLLAAMLPFVLLGIRYPLQMLPVMLFELCWKSIWLIAFAYPLWTSHQIDADTWETIKACLFGWIVFPIVIPWAYVFENYFRKSGDRWWGRQAQPVPMSCASPT